MIYVADPIQKLRDILVVTLNQSTNICINQSAYVKSFFE